MWHSDIIRQKTLSRLYDKYLTQLLQRADCIVATSPNYVEHSPYLRRFTHKCRVVPLGIEPGKFTLNESRQAKVNAIRQRYGPEITLFVGRFTYYKGIDVLLQAAANMSGKLILVGDGPMKNTVQKQITELGLQHKVFIMHDVGNEALAAFYHSCDVFVLPSTERSEAFGIVQLEAMACGKPVVSTDLKSGVPWVNQNGKTGLVIPPNDPEKLSETINCLLKNHQQRKTLGDYARQRVQQKFSLDHVTELMGRVYHYVLTDSHQKDGLLMNQLKPFEEDVTVS